MSVFKVNVVARNPKREELATKPLEALVDTGSELTWLPADVLKGAGITPRRKAFGERRRGGVEYSLKSEN